MVLSSEVSGCDEARAPAKGHQKQLQHSPSKLCLHSTYIKRVDDNCMTT